MLEQEQRALVKRLSYELHVKLGCPPVCVIFCPFCCQELWWCEHDKLACCGYCGEAFLVTE